jgi:hypothetical protein
MPLLALSIVVVILAATFAILFRLLASRQDPASDPVEWLDGFSLESYEPMRRLLDQSDLEFLKKQPGYHPGVVKTLRVERRRAFIDYLGLMITDFNQLLSIGRLMQIHSSLDRPELAQALWRQQIRFYGAVCAIRCRLALSSLGVPMEQLGLGDSLGSMLDQIKELAAMRTLAY